MTPVEKFECRHCRQRVNASHIAPLTDVACPICGETIMAKARLGHYLLHHRAGIGAMGEVFYGEDEMLQRPVAIKFLYMDASREKEQYETLLAEARAAAAIKHPRVVAVYAFGVEDQRPYLVLEWMPGKSLADRLATEGRIPEAKAMAIAVSAFRGLEECHKRGLIHGDIKPGNLLFDDDGDVTLADFGISHLRGTQREGQLKGTPLYVAPEKAVAQTEDQRSDFYSMGIVLWEILAGRPPFDGDDPTTIIQKRVTQPIPDLREAVPEISADTATLVRRLLEPIPVKRVSNYQALNMLLYRASESARRSATRAGAELDRPVAEPTHVKLSTRGLNKLKALFGRDTAKV